MYQVLTAGAVCARPYSEPFFSAEKERRAEFLENCANGTLTDPDSDPGVGTLTDQDLEYLRQFPVYNFNADEESASGRLKVQEYEALFGPFAEWLIVDGKRRGLEANLNAVEIGPYEAIEPETEPEILNGAQLGAVWEVLRPSMTPTSLTFPQLAEAQAQLC